jgi:hypothetical protein
MVEQYELLSSWHHCASLLFTKGPNPKLKPDDEVGDASKVLIAEGNRRASESPQYPVATLSEADYMFR